MNIEEMLDVVLPWILLLIPALRAEHCVACSSGPASIAVKSSIESALEESDKGLAEELVAERKEKQLRMALALAGCGDSGQPNPYSAASCRRRTRGGKKG